MWVVVAVRCCSHAGGVRVGCNNYQFCPELCAWECNEPMEFDRIMIQFCAFSPIRNPYLMFLSIVIPIHRNALMLISPPCSIICNTVPSVRAHWNPAYIYTYFGWFLYIWGKIMLGYLTYYLGQIYITPTLTRISGVEKR